MQRTATSDKEFFYMWLHRLEKITREWYWSSDVLWEFLDKLDNEIPNEIKWLWEISKLVFWEYKNEEDFTINFLIQFFRKLWYFDVKYTHWIEEFGKDIVMKIKDNLWNIRHVWVQVKYWDISGSAKWKVEEIITQIDDWFKMPYPASWLQWEVYISEFIFVTNGKYTNNAVKKIMTKITEYSIKNNVYFMDWADIESKLSSIQ
jgi:hypothetical protein